MKTIHINVGSDCSVIPLGMQGEDQVRQICFDCSALSAQYGGGTAALSHQRAQDETPYPAAVTQDGSTVVWLVSNADTALTAGTSNRGACQLDWYTSDGLARTMVWETEVIRSLSAPAEQPPDAVEPWYRALLEAFSSGAVSDAQLASAIADYLSAHPVTASVSAVNGMTGDVTLSALPNPYPLAVNGTSYDGSKAVTLNLPGTDGKWHFVERITAEEDTDSVTIPLPDGAQELLVSGVLRADSGSGGTVTFYPFYSSIAVNGVFYRGAFGFYDYYPGTGDAKFNIELLTDENSSYAQARTACGAIGGNVTKPLTQYISPWAKCGDIDPSAPNPNFAQWHSLQVSRSGIAAGSTFDVFTR